MTATGALFVIVIGILFFSQVSVGDAVARLRSYTAPGDEPKKAGPTSSAFTGKVGRRALRYRAGVPEASAIVYDTIHPAAVAAGGGFVIISGHRPGAVTRRGSASCHRGGPRDDFGAADIVHASGEWEPVDRLVFEARQTPGIGEVIFRGDSDHDPKLGAKTPHAHVAVNCG